MARTLEECREKRDFEETPEPSEDAHAPVWLEGEKAWGGSVHPRREC